MHSGPWTQDRLNEPWMTEAQMTPLKRGTKKSAGVDLSVCGFIVDWKPILTYATFWL